MSKEKYSLHKIDEKQYQLKEYGILQVGMIYTDKEVADWTIDLLNKQSKKIEDLEDTRQRKNKEIAKLKEREELYQRVIGGFQAYVELEANSALWWNLGEDGTECLGCDNNGKM